MLNNRAVKERIKNKLKDSKKTSQIKPKIESDEIKTEKLNEDEEIEEYYLGKDRDEELKKKAYVTFFFIQISNCKIEKVYIFRVQNDIYILYCLKFVAKQ